MRKNRGILVKYTDTSGKTQKGIVRGTDQHESFRKVDKALIRLCNDDLTIMKDENGKGLVALKSIDLLQHIGFCD